MLKKTITYTDYVDRKWTEDFYFNMTTTELTEMEASTNGGMADYLNRIIKAVDRKKLYGLIRDLILNSYGEKSPDGKRFVKSKELSEAFSQTPAYDVLFMELATSDEAAAEFVKAIIPSDLMTKMEENLNSNDSDPLSIIPTKITEVIEDKNA